jgi:hypothetical protein
MRAEDDMGALPRDEELDFLHDGRLTGIEIDEKRLRLTFIVDSTKIAMEVTQVDRLVALPVLEGNTVYRVDVAAASAIDWEDLPLSNQMKSAFVETYGLLATQLTTYQGHVLVLYPSYGCELFCMFTGDLTLRQ